VAVSEGRALVAWADRGRGRPSVEVVYWVKGAAPSRPQALAVAGRGGAEVVGSPAVAAAGAGRFAIAWAEVAGASAYLRVAVLSPEGTVVGEPVSSPALEQSPPALDLALAEGGRGLLAYLMPVGKGAELAAMPVLCGD
jgi:hypothetical protein